MLTFLLRRCLKQPPHLALLQLHMFPLSHHGREISLMFFFCVSAAAGMNRFLCSGLICIQTCKRKKND